MPARQSAGGAGARRASDFAIASADMSTGSFRSPPLKRDEIAAELARLAPRELLAPDGLLADETLAPLLEGAGPGADAAAVGAVRFRPAASGR